MTDAATPPDGAATALDRAREHLARAATALADAGARREVLAEFVPERRVLGVPRAARMAPVGRVWRLGVVLLDDTGSAWATGRVVRAERRARKSITAESVAEQRAYRAAAVKGGIAEGETVNFDASPIDLDELARVGSSGPLALVDDEVFVRWSTAQPDALTPLDAVPRGSDRPARGPARRCVIPRPCARHCAGVRRGLGAPARHPARLPRCVGAGRSSSMALSYLAGVVVF